MSITLLKKTLTSAFQPSQALVIADRTVTLDFKFTVSNGPATIEWYLELGEDPSPTGDWYREVAQEDPGNGNVAIPIVVRTFALNGGGGLTDGSYLLDAEMVRRHKLARVQIRATAGTVSMQIIAPFGMTAIAPAT